MGQNIACAFSMEREENQVLSRLKGLQASLNKAEERLVDARAQRSAIEAAIAALQEGSVLAIAGDRADLLGPSYDIEGLGVLPLRLTQVPLALVSCIVPPLKA